MPLVIPEFLSARFSRPAAILGGGVSGGGARALLSSLGASTAIYDRDGEPFTEARAREHRFVVFSPGFSLHHPWLEVARKAGCICMAEIDFASVFWLGRIVAVTGTNGKTTLTEFLTHALGCAGRRARAAGNIGLPLSRLVADEDGGAPQAMAVCEVSSFQAEQLGHFRADALLWTNFAEDHLERHAGMEAYFAAKWELVIRTPANRFFAGSSVRRFAARSGRAMPPGASVETEGQAADPRLDGTPFASYPQRENFILAAAWWRSEGLDEAALYAAARTFRLGRHRLCRVAEIEGVAYWNDSKATNFHAVEAALAGLPGPAVLIAGGKSKGGDIAGFVRRIAPRVAHAVLIGETGPALAAAFDECGVSHAACDTLEDAVRAAAAAAKAGGNVLLSPGFSSFDMFRNYEDRGDHFERAVTELHAAHV
ncbi:MAG TPA: UDP-N-acetylmuramoyl-L-alanine--D-glutamate ligase [Opitutaceae bacterium]|nr:UDP-N-acetylmuramoyl-L-alanine--D-glutamate ligase [Opitutaceae bacterium]